MSISDGSSHSGPKPGPQRRRLSLSGRSVTLDPSLNAVRGDLADIALADSVFAPHYAEALPYLTRQAVAVRETASADAAIRAELPAGVRFNVLDVSGGWAWGRGAEEGSVGYVPRDSIAPA